MNRFSLSTFFLAYLGIAVLGCMDRGVLILDAGRNVLRFLPPLIIEREQVDRVVDVLDSVMAEDNK